MKVEKISDNKIKIILSFEELEMRNINLRDIENDNNAAKKLFYSLIDEISVDEDFECEGSQLFIEASSDYINTFILTITKQNDIPNLNSYSNISNKLPFKINSRLYEFNSLDTILDFCNIAKDEKIFFGKNSLYKYDNRYYVLFSDSAIKNKKFIKTYVMLSEYCTRYFSYDTYYCAITEKGSSIITNKALQKLMLI